MKDLTVLGSCRISLSGALGLLKDIGISCIQLFFNRSTFIIQLSNINRWIRNCSAYIYARTQYLLRKINSLDDTETAWWHGNVKQNKFWHHNRILTLHVNSDATTGLNKQNWRRSAVELVFNETHYFFGFDYWEISCICSICDKIFFNFWVWKSCNAVYALSSIASIKHTQNKKYRKSDEKTERTKEKKK